MLLTFLILAVSLASNTMVEMHKSFLAYKRQHGQGAFARRKSNLASLRICITYTNTIGCPDVKLKALLLQEKLRLQQRVLYPRRPLLLSL